MLPEAGGHFQTSCALGDRPGNGGHSPVMARTIQRVIPQPAVDPEQVGLQRLGRPLRGGVVLYAAQAKPQIDAGIAEKRRFRTETNYNGCACGCNE